MNDARRDSTAFHKNIGPITEKLKVLLPGDELKVLEVGSGSGRHTVSLAKTFPNFTFQPTDIEQESLDSINAWISHENIKNVSPGKMLDVTQPASFLEEGKRYDVILCFNVIHISPWVVTEQLFQLANKVTASDARLFLYGPFRIDGKQTSDSNAQFELWLKSMDERFGVRDTGDVQDVAAKSGFLLEEKHIMPSNNFLMQFTRA